MTTGPTIRLTSVALVFIVLAAVPRGATAMSCAGTGSIAAEVTRATTIVLAKVGKVARPKSQVQEEAGRITVSYSSGTPNQIDLAIEETFKGSVPRAVQIETTLNFIAGGRYLIYGVDAADRLVLAPCTRILAVSEADADLRYLEAARRGVWQGVIYGQVSLRSMDGKRSLPVGDATVVASSRAYPRQGVKAGKYGGFTMVLSPGGYLFWIERDGRQVTDAEHVDVAAGDQPKFFAVVASPGEMAHDRQITGSAVGPIALGMTLEDARRETPAAEFRRTSDGDGAALVEIVLGPNASMLVQTDEDNPEAPIDWTGRIQSIETFAAGFNIAGLIAPGTSVEAATRVWGPVQDIVVSEIEARQFISFENQPEGVTLRLDGTGQFPRGVRHTRQYQSDGKILSIAISIH
jgi:hypothetical protein